MSRAFLFGDKDISGSSGVKEIPGSPVELCSEAAYVLLSAPIWRRVRHWAYRSVARLMLNATVEVAVTGVPLRR